MDRNYDGITLILKYLYFKKARVAIFADIIKIVTIFIKTIFKNSKKWKELLDIAKFAYFDVSRTQRVCHVIHNFLDLFWVRYNFAKFVIIGCVKDFREGAFWPPPPIREQPHLNKVNKVNITKKNTNTDVFPQFFRDLR